MDIDYRSLGLSLWTLLAIPALGQTVTTDTTVGSVITTDNSLFTITEGTVRSDSNNATLFHSFETFSPGAANVSFDLRASQNALDTSAVTAIIGRITGSSSSFIDGQLSIQQDGGTPTADLFLINPNGITFGDNASLLLPGSFFASTAESVLFEKGLSFSSRNPGAAPMLTVSSPIGLQLGNNPGAIQVIGLGQTIITNSDPTSLITSPSIRIPGALATLDVANSRTIGLIGGDVLLQGSSVRANNGRIEIGGVSRGTVGLQPNGIGWDLDYTETTADHVVLLASKSALDASGLTSQGIQIVGGQVNVQDGSVVLMQVFGDAP
ncbi:MAG: filamentous hemagglutinin N-terminal domain-containing protein, partial [Cyanobacteria bacterium P01_D01_bin.56]